jgi:hypothetical protein
MEIVLTAAIWVYACAALLLITALVHSVLGERRLIVPLLRSRDGVLGSELARFLLRFVWHFMSILFAIIAVTLVASQHAVGSATSVLLGATAIGIGGAGLFDAIGSRGRHIGWPMLVLIGIFALLALRAA